MKPNGQENSKSGSCGDRETLSTCSDTSEGEFRTHLVRQRCSGPSGYIVAICNFMENLETQARSPGGLIHVCKGKKERKNE